MTTARDRWRQDLVSAVDGEHTAPGDEPAGDDVTVTDRPASAAGVTAVAVALGRSLRRMGPRRTLTTLRLLNQTDGYDCPGCAWPDPAPGDRSVAEFCENGAKAVAEEATTRRVTREFFARHSLAELEGWDDYLLGQQGRLTEPMVVREGGTHYEPIGWDEAYRMVGETLRGLDDPNQAIFYTSGRASNEAAFTLQLFARAFGTNNLPDCSNMCHESTSVALAETIGIGKGSVTLQDVHEAELIVVMGQNPGTNHPRMLTALETAKRNGGRIVAINPLPEAGLMRFKNPQNVRGVVGPGTPLADLFLQIRAGGDLALFQAVGALLLQRPESLDHHFIARHTRGFEAWREHLAGLDWDAVDAATGLPREQIEALADAFAHSRRTVVCWAMGITQHAQAVATIKEIVNVVLAQGNIGKPGAGMCPVRGHSNVQGDRTMGIWDKLPDHFAGAMRKEFSFDPPEERGHDVVNTIRALHEGKASFLLGLGGNLASAVSDTTVSQAAMRRADLSVAIATKLNRSHVVIGRRALLLPTIGRTERILTERGEQAVTVEDSMSEVHLSRGRLEPPSPHCRSEVAILCGIAQATLGDRVPAIDWTAMAQDFHLVRRHIGSVVPGCEAYDEKVHREGGFVLPHPARDTRTFRTTSEKAEFTVTPLRVIGLPEGHLFLQGLRSHDQFNTTIYGHDDRYRGLSGGRQVVMVHPDDLAAQGFADGDLVDIVAPWANGSQRVVTGYRAVAYPTARGCVAAYYPEVNPLLALDSTAEGSNCPTSKGVVVRLVRPGQHDGHRPGDPEPLGSDAAHRSTFQPFHLS